MGILIYATQDFWGDQKAVNSAFIRFSGLLYELKLTPLQDEALAVKLEVNTNPLGGAVLETSLVRCHLLLNLWRHDRVSLLSGNSARSYNYLI